MQQHLVKRHNCSAKDAEQVIATACQASALSYSVSLHDRCNKVLSTLYTPMKRLKILLTSSEASVQSSKVEAIICSFGGNCAPQACPKVFLFMMFCPSDSMSCVLSTFACVHM
eukprot:3522673-Amphidinium_carterae.1